MRKFIHADVFPERAPHKGRHRSILEPYIPYIHQRWVEGCHNALQLWRAMKEEGYGGQAGMVRRYVRRLRTQLAELTPEQQHARLLEAKTTFKAPSSRRAAWWLVEQTEDLDDHQRVFVEQLKNLAREGDALVAISGSGNSQNVLRVVEWANRRGLKTFGCTGFGGGGARL